MRIMDGNENIRHTTITRLCQPRSRQLQSRRPQSHQPRLCRTRPFKGDTHVHPPPLRGPPYPACRHHAEPGLFRPRLHTHRHRRRAPCGFRPVHAAERDWMFRYYASIYDLDAEVSRRHQAGLPAFHDRGFIDSLGVSDEPRPDELRAAGYSSIPVPSVWQNHGVDRHQYTNVNYRSRSIRRMCRRTIRAACTCIRSSIAVMPPRRGRS